MARPDLDTLSGIRLDGGPVVRLGRRLLVMQGAAFAVACAGVVWLAFQFCVPTPGGGASCSAGGTVQALAAMAAILLGIGAGALLAWSLGRDAARAAGAAAELQAMVRQGLDGAPTGIVVVEAHLPDTPIVYVNDAFGEMTGYSRAEALGRNPRFLHGPLTDAGVMDRVRRDVAAGIRSTHRVLNYRKDGTPFWNELRIAPIRDLKGSVRYFLGTLNDVTAEVERQAELERRVVQRTAALEAAQAHLAGVLDNIADMVVTIDGEGLITSVNAATCQILGWTAAELIGRDVSFLAAEPDRSRHHEYLARYRQTGQSRILGVRARELTAQMKDGSRLPIELTIGEMKTGSGPVFVGVMRDIRARRDAEAEIETARARLADVVASANEAIALFDAGDRLTLFNDSFRSLFAGPGDGVRTGAVFADILADAVRGGGIRAGDRPPESFIAERLALRRAGSAAPHHYRMGDGRWLQVTEKPTREGGIAMVATDITALMLEREALRRSESKLARAQEIAGTGSWEVDLETYDLEWSAGTYRIFGLDPIDRRIDFDGFKAMIHPDDYQAVRLAGLAAVRGEGGRYDVQHRIRRADGSVRHVRQIAEVERDGDGGRARFLGTIRDVTEQIALEEELRRRADQLRLVTDNLPMMVAYVDAGQRYRFVNRLAAEWLGRPADELVGRCLADVLSPQAYAAVLPGVTRVLAGETLRHREGSLAPGGRRLDIQRIPHRLADGTIAGYLSVVADVTAQERTEEQLRQAQKMEVVGQLTGGIAHDFNNFLGVILGNLDLALPLIEDRPKPAEFVGRAIAAVERSATLTRRLLSFSRRQALEPRIVDPGAILGDMRDLIRQSVGEPVAVELDCAPSLWSCRLDRLQFESAVMNLCVNARDAMPRGGTIAIGAANLALAADETGPYPDAAPGDYVEISVTDTGSGMPPEVAARVFEPFFTTKGAGKGTGLGLSMVLAFVQEAGGRIAVRSRPGAGTTVSFILPRRDQAGRAEAGAGGEPPASPRGELGGGRLILVVEDNEEVRAFVVSALARMGFRTVEAGDVAAALAILDAEPAVALVFTDVLLPGGRSGLDLAQDLAVSRPALPVLLTSGFTGTDAATTREIADAGRILFKPYRAEDLAAKLAALLHGTPA